MLGDVISINWDEGHDALTFMKKAEGTLVPVTSSEPGTIEEADAATNGRAIVFSAARAAAEINPEPPTTSAHRNRQVEKVKNENRKSIP
jgi:hypothetical protein